MPDLKLTKPGAIFVSEGVAQRHAGRIASLAPRRPIALLGPDGPQGPFERVEIAFFSGDCYPDRAAMFAGAVFEAPGLRWLHSFSAGIDNPAFGALLDRGVRVSHSSGANAVAVAQAAVMSLLALARDMPNLLAAQRDHRWERRASRDLEGATLAILGLGAIGLEVARVATALRLRVIGMRRTPCGDEPCETWGFERLPELLGLADYLVLALPLTPETYRLLDEENLALLKPDAALVNVGRGELIDEKALITGLQKGALRGAALDVFEQEPLAETSPLWDLPGVIVTPHSAGLSPASHLHAEEIFLENLACYERNEPLLNEVPQPATGEEGP